MFDHPKVAILVIQKVDDETGVGECKQCFIFPEKSLKVLEIQFLNLKGAHYQTF